MDCEWLGRTQVGGSTTRWCQLERKADQDFQAAAALLYLVADAGLTREDTEDLGDYWGGRLSSALDIQSYLKDLHETALFK